MELESGGDSDPRWTELESALVHGGPIDVRWLAAETPYWEGKLRALAGKRWLELSFFELEFVFYLALRSIAAELAPGIDIFARTRHAALVDALPKIATAVDARGEIGLEAALLETTLGNEADLSQLAEARPGIERVSLLVDERSEIIERSNAGSIIIVADNAGSELCFDLILVDLLLSAGARSVELHVKPRPMFVSDALPSDVQATVAGFALQPRGSALGRIGARLREALADGRLTLCAPADWSEPRCMNELEPELTTRLRSAALVLLKGDLNYRRCFEDRAWPADTPVATASVALGMHACALRVLKSDSVVGLASAQVSQLFAADAQWRTNGTQAVIQRVDAGAGD